MPDFSLNALNYNFAKFLLSMLKLLTSNEFTMKNYFDFPEEIADWQLYLCINSLNVDSMFNRYPLAVLKP